MPDPDDRPDELMLAATTEFARRRRSERERDPADRLGRTQCDEPWHKARHRPPLLSETRR